MTSTQIRHDVSFANLVTEALTAGQTGHITRLPRTMFDTYELSVIDFVKSCTVEGYAPTIEIMKQHIHFIPKPLNLPLDILYRDFTLTRREGYLAQKQIELMEQNRKDGKPEMMGLVDFIRAELDKTAIPSPKIISYRHLNRRLYETDIKTMSWEVPHLDSLTDGIVGGDFIVVMAATKVGKTTLFKIAVQGAFDSNQTVMFCSQEQAVLKMTQQLDLQRLRKPHSALRHGVDEETMSELLQLEKAVQHGSNDIYITPQVKSVTQLHEYIQSCEVKPDKVFIDGLNLMTSSHTDNSYSSLAQTCAELKEYANEKNIAIIVVTQTNRSGMKAGANTDGTHIAGSAAILMFADNVIAMTVQEVLLNDGNIHKVAYLRSILNRHGDTDNKVFMETIYKDKRFGVNFMKVDPKWTPDMSNVSDAIKSTAKAKFEIESGMSFEELDSTAQQALVELEALTDSNAVDIDDEFGA